jgi:hypothetical protein
MIEFVQYELKTESYLLRNFLKSHRDDIIVVNKNE